MATQTKNPVEKAKEVASSEPVKKVEQQTKPFQQFLTKFNNDGTMTFAATLAYNLMLAMFPILIALISILGFVLNGLAPSAVQTVQSSIVHSFPGSSQDTVSQILTGVQVQLRKSAGILALIAVLTAVFGGSRLFIVIEQFLDLIYHLRPRPFLRQNIVAIVMVLLFIVLIPIMVFASVAPALVLSLTSYIPFLHDNPVSSKVIGYIGGILGGIVAGFILFEFIYVVMPNQKISIKHSWLGALVAAVALEIFLVAFPFYATYFLKGYAGVVGGAIILLLFFYYFAVILLLGGEINAFFSERVQPLPNDVITFISTMAGRVNKDHPDSELAHVDPRPTEKADDSRFGGATRGRGGRNTNQRNGQGQHSSSTNTQRRDSSKSQKNDSKSQNVSAQVQEKNLAKSQKEFAKSQKEMTKEPKVQSPAATALEIAAGAALTVVIEFLRLRRHGGK